MTTTASLIEGLEQRCAEYGKNAQTLREQLATVEDLERACRILLADIKRNAKPADGPRGLHAHIRPSQLAHCKSQTEAWIEIARRSGGFARPSDAAQLFLEAGLSQGKRRSVVSTGTNYMIDSDDWQRTEAGTFRYLAYDPQNDDGPGEDQWLEEHSMNANGVALPLISPDGAELAVGRVQTTA